MSVFVYCLCGLTSFVCTLLLTRAYMRSRLRLLLWSALCFTLITVNNVLLFFDVVVIGPETDLSPYRTFFALASVVVLLYGLIWDAH